MGQKVEVYHIPATSWYSDVEDSIKELYEKYGDRLIDWKIATNKNGEFIIWYVLKPVDDMETQELIKV